MAVNTDIKFIPRGIFTRNGVIRASHPDTYARLANGLYSKLRKRIHGHFYDDGDSFVPTGASYTQVNSNPGPDLDVFNAVAHLGQSTEGRLNDVTKFSLILHVFGQDCNFRASFEDQAITMTCLLGTSLDWYKIELDDAFTATSERWDNISFDCIDNGTTPEVRGWLLEEAILVL